ncbi:lithostathine-1-beta-like [Rhynchophorus ferrugineus]|uniref:C-type lectin domain-containing protein n=1 Tax=Rhynchophorus ferrugineus TaxID=354439 RepID=A0A834I5K8_RHYFE|nr:hypothetical protein GWI33_014175 [Rhynchophorus ferrugineus]
MHLLLFFTLLGLHAVVGSLNYTSFVHSDNYHVSTSTDTFANALFNCKRMGWTMAIEDSAEATAAVNKILNDTSHNGDNVWIGGVYQEISGYFSQWIWIDSGAIIEYTNWQSGEPSASSSNPCVRKNAQSSSYPGQWYAYSCTNTLYFVCKGSL